MHQYPAGLKLDDCPAGSQRDDRGSGVRDRRDVPFRRKINAPQDGTIILQADPDRTAAIIHPEQGVVVIEIHDLEKIIQRREACLFCHEAHDSRYPKLLVDLSPSLCLQCHQPELQGGLTGPEHDDLGRDCLECHLSHGGHDRYFLRPSEPGAPPEPAEPVAPASPVGPVGPAAPA